MKNTMHRYILLIAILLAGCGPKKNTAESRVCLLGSKAELMWLLEEHTKEKNATAESNQSQIQLVLKGAALKAYKAERKAFSDWYEYQEVVSSEVISEIWDLYYGGTAGDLLN